MDLINHWSEESQKVYRGAETFFQRYWFFVWESVWFIWQQTSARNNDHGILRFLQVLTYSEVDSARTDIEKQ